jgi:hypothetical protein
MVREVLSIATDGPQNIGQVAKKFATSTLTDTVGSHFAGKIGESREEDGYWLHKGKHAALGAGTGALSDLSNPLRGAASGAFGAVIAECTAEGCVDSFTRDSQDLEELQAGIQKAAAWGKMAAPTVAVLMGLDGGIAQRAGNNALENNFLVFTIPLRILDVDANIETAIEIYDIYQQEGIKPAAERLGIELLYNAAGVGYFRVGKSIFKSGSKVVDHVLKMNPRIKAQLGANADKLRGKLDELVGSRVRKINNRMPINAEYAGKVYPLEKFPKEIRNKYPHSVPFIGTGHPDFSRYATKKVEIEMTGKEIDFTRADRAAGFKKRPENYTWHHHHDGKSMYLVPTDIHEAVRHTGGRAIIKQRENKK